MVRKKTPNLEELRSLPPFTLLEEKKEEKKKKKKWQNPHKREYGIEIVERVNEKRDLGEPEHKVSIDIGYTTSGLTHWDILNRKVKSLYYKKNEQSLVKGAGIVYLTKLCEETYQKYLEILPEEVRQKVQVTQFILEEPLVIAGQKSFSISLYVLLHYLITKLLYDFDCHSIVLVRPGSAKKLLNWGRSKMPDGEKTKWIKEHLPEWETKNNHTADSNFSMILTNYEKLKELYPSIALLNKVDYQIYRSYL